MKKLMNIKKAVRSIFCFTKSDFIEFKWEYAVGGLCSLLILFSYAYSDFQATLGNGLAFWEALFDGHVFSFYSYAASIPIGIGDNYFNCGAAYDFTIYFVFAIWNVAAGLFKIITGIQPQKYFIFLAWAKLMFPFFALITAAGMKKIIILITQDKREASGVIYMFLSSGILIMMSYYISQYDIVGLAFVVWGVYAYLKKEYKKFIILFAIAISCKYFALLPFLPLILLVEKRYIHIIKNIILGFSVSFIEKLFFLIGSGSITAQVAGSVSRIQNAAAVGASVAPTSLTEHLFTNFFSNRLDNFGISSFCFFPAVYICILVYAYLQVREDTYRFMYKTIYLVFASYAAFLTLAYALPYWNVIMVPFMILLIFMNGRNQKLNVLLETVCVWAYFPMALYQFPWIFSGDFCYGMLWSHLLGDDGTRGSYGSIAYMLQMACENRALWGMVFTRLAPSVYNIAILILLVINRPGKCQERYIAESVEPYERKEIRANLIIRECVNILFLMLPFLLYIYKVIR